jgi:Tfp pilus assembly PilM family ATPase
VTQGICRGSNAEITRAAAEPLNLPPAANRSDPEALGRAIAHAIAQARIKPGPVLMGVPRAHVVLRTLTLPPPTDPSQLAGMIHLQIARDLPFRADEAVIDFQVRTQIEPATPAVPPPEPNPAAASDPAPSAGPKLEVLVGVVRREVVDFHRKLAAAAGLKLAALGLLPYANARCAQACGAADQDAGVAIVTLRSDEVGIDVVVHDALLFSRGAVVKPRPEGADPAAVAPSGPADSDPAPTGPAPPAPDRSGFPVESVTIEVVRSLHSYAAMEPRHPVAKVVVAGATGREAELAQALGDRLTLPCTVLNLAAGLRLPEDVAPHAAGALFGIGLVLGAGDPQGLPFDFLNSKQPAPPRNPRRAAILIGLAALVAITVVLVGVRAYLVGQRLQLQTKLQAELVEARKKRPVYRQMRQQHATIQEWLKEGRNWLEHCAYLSAVLPASEEVYLTSVAIGAQGTLRLSVQARSGAVLAKLDQQLRAAGYDVKPIAIHPGSDRFGYEFRSTVELVVPPKFKLDLAKVQPPPPRPADDASLDTNARRHGGSQ